MEKSAGRWKTCWNILVHMLKVLNSKVIGYGDKRVIKLCKAYSVWDVLIKSGRKKSQEGGFLMNEFVCIKS